MKSRTPKKTSASNNDASSFIDGAENNPKKRVQRKSAVPWDDPRLREDVTKIFNLRLSEKHFAMMKYLSDNLPRTSMQNICLDTLEPMLEHESLNLFKKLNPNKR